MNTILETCNEMVTTLGLAAKDPMTSLALKQAELLDDAKKISNFMQKQEDDTEDLIELKDFLPEGSTIASDFAICGDKILVLFLKAADEAKTQYEDIYNKSLEAAAKTYGYANVPGNPIEVSRNKEFKLGAAKVFHDIVYNLRAEAESVKRKNEKELGVTPQQLDTQHTGVMDAMQKVIRDRRNLIQGNGEANDEANDGNDSDWDT